MVDLQSTNRVKIARVREVTFGVTPASPAFKAIRTTGQPNLGATPTTVTSAEIRSDRQIKDQILVDTVAGGDLPGEMSFQSMDDDLEEALQGTWTNMPNAAVSALSTTTATIASGGASYKAGMLCLFSGFANATNNGIFPVVSNTGTTVVFTAATFTAEASPPAGASIRVVGFNGASADIVAVTSGGNALTTTALDCTTLGLIAGMWAKVGGATSGLQFATAANNDFVRISAIAAGKLTLDRVPSGWTADTGTGKTVQLFFGDFLTNASTKRSNTIERQYLDHSPVSYELLTGQTLDKFGIVAKSAAVVTVSRTYMGAAASISTTRTAGATDVAAPTNDVLNASSNVGRIGFNSSVITGPNYVMEAQINIANNLRRQTAVGTLGAVGIGNGEFSVSGSLNTYFGDKTVLDKVLANTLTSFDIRLGRTDSNNESLVFDMPSIKLSSGSPAVSGKNADVMLQAGFQAILDATYGYTLSVGRFWSLP